MKYRVDLLCAQDLLCGEGPLWDAAEQTLYWTESLGEKIFRCRSGGEAILHHQGVQATSLALNGKGGLVISGKDGFMSLSKYGRVIRHPGKVGAIPVNRLNDIIADPHGRVFSGQDVFAEDKEYLCGYVFRLDPGGNVKIVADGMHLANGMAFSPTCDTLYVADTILARIYSFKYDMMSGDLSAQKVFVQFNKNDGLPDGMTVDSEGFLWVALFFGGKILRIDPDGRIEREIRLPCKQPTSVAFGGKDLNELFITSAALKWETAFAPGDHDYQSYRGGSLYRIYTDVQGKEEYRAAI